MQDEVMGDHDPPRRHQHPRSQEGVYGYVRFLQPLPLQNTIPLTHQDEVRNADIPTFTTNSGQLPQQEDLGQVERQRLLHSNRDRKIQATVRTTH